MKPVPRPERLARHRNWHTTQIDSIKVLLQVPSTRPPIWRHDLDFHFGLLPKARYQHFYHDRKDEPGTEYRAVEELEGEAHKVSCLD